MKVSQRKMASAYLVLPLENELRSVEGVDEIQSYSGENSSSLIVQFNASQDVDQALLDVREAVDRAKVELPSSAEEPSIYEMSTDDFPVLAGECYRRGRTRAHAVLRSP